MFFRTKKVKGYEYLQIVESYRENGKMRQRVRMTLGNYQHWKDSGKLDSLLASGAWLSERLVVLSEYQGQERQACFVQENWIGHDIQTALERTRNC